MDLFLIIILLLFVTPITTIFTVDTIRDQTEGWILKSFMILVPASTTVLAIGYSISEFSHRQGPWHFKEAKDLLAYDAIEAVLNHFLKFMDYFTFTLKEIARAASYLSHLLQETWNENAAVFLYCAAAAVALSLITYLILSLQAWHIKAEQRRYQDKLQQWFSNVNKVDQDALPDLPKRPPYRQAWKKKFSIYRSDGLFFDRLVLRLYGTALLLIYSLIAGMAGPLIVLIVAPSILVLGAWAAFLIILFLFITFIGFVMGGMPRIGIRSRF